VYLKLYKREITFDVNILQRQESERKWKHLLIWNELFLTTNFVIEGRSECAWCLYIIAYLVYWFITEFTVKFCLFEIFLDHTLRHRIDRSPVYSMNTRDRTKFCRTRKPSVKTWQCRIKGILFIILSICDRSLLHHTVDSPCSFNRIHLHTWIFAIFTYT
jgi:hypothetical protein